MSYGNEEILEQFEEQLQTDINKIFKLDNDNENGKEFKKAYEESNEAIFNQFLGDISWYNEDDVWIKEIWVKGQKFLELDTQQTDNPPISPLSFENHVLKGFKRNIEINDDHRKYFFTNKGSHWNISNRAGYSIKQILKDNKQAEWQAQLEQEINSLVSVKVSGDLDTIVQKITQSGLKDASVIPHMVYPQFFPAWYITTKDGYSQTNGIMKILQNTVDIIDFNGSPELKINENDLRNEYDKYASAYRFILWGYHNYLKKIFEKNKTNKIHWDYLTQFLADIDTLKDAELLLERKKALILYGVPGTGKTYRAKKIAEKFCDNKSIFKILQLHPNYAYQDFVLGIKPESTNGNSVTYPVKPGPLYRACYEAATNTTGENSKYVLILDEINRADLSKVLGELMYCLEYRGQDNTIVLPQKLSDNSILPFFNANKNQSTSTDPFKKGEEFYFPENLYFIGTMNTVDRSLSGFDVALRRRFGWFRLNYNENELHSIIEEKINPNNSKNQIIQNLEMFIKRCTQLNSEKLKEIGLDRDHEIGHTYFAEIADIILNDKVYNNNIKKQIHIKHLEVLWLYHIEPLLEEYLGFELDSYANQDKINELRKFFCQKI